MGTNYYAKENECMHCGRYEEIHIGKSSSGWQFSFQYNGGKYYKDIHEMKDWLADRKIIDEYDQEVSHDKFWAMIENKQRTEKRNHAKMVYQEYPHHADYEYVIHGYSFSDCEFS